MNKVVGVLAHVDAGKTSFSEQLLYKTGAIKQLGRVDHKTSYLDKNEIEQNRGITIFADQAEFSIGSNNYYLIDTPGHVDFFAETERAVKVLDYAIIVISGSHGVQAHTLTLFDILKKHKVPTFFFINKCDMENFDLENCIKEIKEKLTDDVLFVDKITNIEDLSNESILEFVAERNEDFLNKYLDGDIDVDETIDLLKKMIFERNCFVAMKGSALKDVGIDEFISVFDKLTDYQDESDNSDFLGNVYKIRYDENGNRLTFIKCKNGKLNVKDEFLFLENQEIYSEKINEIRFYNGVKYESRPFAEKGQVFAVTGLKNVKCGAVITKGQNNSCNSKENYLTSALQSKINILDNTDVNVCMQKLRIIEAEEPTLNVEYNELTKEIIVNIMGKIQLEVLEQIFFKRFNIKIGFEKPKVQYKETISNTVIGFGHYEPLRHYAEVQLRLEPNERNKGIEFSSECHVDRLAINYQNLIKTHVFEKQHKGILTGYPITDIKIILQDGLAHLKHTEGGDFREATYRAIRQGLEKAQNILLEPFYKYEISVDDDFVGRVLSDIQKMRGSFDMPKKRGNQQVITGLCPVETMMDYTEELMAFTKGYGSINLILDGYYECEISDKVIEKIGYDKGADKENTSCSVFCKKGAGFVVNWNEVEDYAHTLRK